MGKQTQSEIARLKAQIATLEATENVEDLQTAISQYAKTPNDAKASDAMYRVAKSFCNTIERAKRLQAKGVQ